MSENETSLRDTIRMLQATRDEMVAIVDASPAAIYSLDTSGRVRTWNRAAEEIFGWKAHEVVGAPLPTVQRETKEEFQELMRHLLEGGRFEGLEITRQRKSGAFVSLSVTSAPLRGPSGEVEGLMVVAVDISPQKRAEAALIESERRYQELVESLDDVVFSWDDKGVFRYMSPAMERRFGFRPEEFLGRSFGEFVHPADLERIKESFLATLRGKKRPEEFRAWDKNGKLRHLRSSSRVLLEDGRPVGITGVITDFSDYREMQDELKDRVPELRRLRCWAELLGGD